MSEIIFHLPDLGEGLTEAQIHEWHVKEGQQIKAEEALLSVETAKAIVDIPSPYDGTVHEFFGDASDLILTGKPLVSFRDVKQDPQKSTVAGVLESTQEVIEAEIFCDRLDDTIQSVKALPAVRLLAKELGIDLADITPTGKQGEITAGDVTLAANQPSGFHPLSNIDRTMAQRMQQSAQSVVPVSIVDDADISKWSESTDMTVRLIQAISYAISQEPDLNRWFDGNTLSVKHCETIDIGIAMDSSEGLFMPVLRNASALDETTIRSELNRLKIAVNDRSISNSDLLHPTISLTNFGVFAGRYANPIIVPPMVAIIGAGKVRREVVEAPAHSGQLTVHPVLPLSLTVDHRAVTGGQAARFLKALITSLEKTTAK